MIVDLYKELTTNELFMRRVNKAFLRVKDAETAMLKGTYNGEQILDKRIQELLEICGWNLGILIPLYFPTFIDGQPLNPMRRPHSFMMLSLFTYGYTAVRGSRQIAKSTKLIARQLIKAMIFSRHKSIYICPHPEHKKTYANRFREMEVDCPYVRTQQASGLKLRNNLFFKEYANKSQTYLVNALTDTSQARSKTADELMYDEYQLFDIDLEGDIEQCQSVSMTPMTVYAGTSTTVDSPLEYRYQEGSQAHWMVKSPNDKDWLDFGDEEMMLKMIRPEGLRCPFTGRPFDVTKGFYEHLFPSRLDYGHVSVHVPQLIIPDKVSDQLEWNKIYKAFTEYSPAKFMEEILGVPTEEGSSEISVTDLKNMAILGTMEELMDKVNNGYYKFLVSGCDWGGSDHIKTKKDKLSYTVHAILGVTPDDKVDIVYIKQYTGMDFFGIAKQIIATHKRYGAMAMAGDSGMGQAYNLLMEAGLGDCPHYSMSYSGNLSDLMRSPKHGAPNQIMLNRTDSVSQLFLDIKRGGEVLRCYNWGESASRLMEFLNLKRVLVDGPNGSSKFFYNRVPTQVDDSLHAVNFAYVLTKVLMGKNIINDAHLRQSVLTNTMQQSGNYEGAKDFGWGFGDIVSG